MTVFLLAEQSFYLKVAKNRFSRPRGLQTGLERVQTEVGELKTELGEVKTELAKMNDTLTSLCRSEKNYEVQRRHDRASIEPARTRAN